VELAVPSGKHWEIKSLRFTLTTEDTVANRSVALSLLGNGTEFWRWRASVAHVAETAWTYNYLASLNDEVDRTTDFDELYAPLPRDLILGPGYRLETTTENLQTVEGSGSGSGSGVEPQDQFSELSLYVVEYG
jgi:hypothetical protein